MPYEKKKSSKVAKIIAKIESSSIHPSIHLCWSGPQGLALFLLNCTFKKKKFFPNITVDELLKVKLPHRLADEVSLEAWSKSTPVQGWISPVNEEQRLSERGRPAMQICCGEESKM